MPIKNITSGAYTSSADDSFVKFNCGSNAIEVTLLAPKLYTKENTITFKKVDSTANAVTINGTNIDGASSVQLTALNEYITLIPNGNGFGVVDSNKAVFGDYAGGNYSEFEPDGTLKFNGTSTTWIDVDFPIIIRTTGVGIPTLETVQGNITAPQWQVDDVNICEGQELIHPWKEGSEVRWHLHMITNGSEATAKYVKWEIEWFWVTPDGAISASDTQSQEITIPANTTSKTMLVASIYQWTPTNGKIASHVFARLKRIASSGAAPLANPWCSMLQLHIECDTVGSREYMTK